MSASTAVTDAPGRTSTDDVPADLPRRITMWALGIYLATRFLVIGVARLPEITPDEPGSWAVARWLSGASGVITMGDMPRYPLVPGAVLTPLWWLPVSTDVRYQLGLAVLTATTVLAAFTVRSAIRMLGADDLLAAACFALVLLVPASTFSGAFTWAEPTVLLWWAVLFWGVVACATRVRPTAVLVVTSLVAGSAPFAHGRLAAIPVLWLGFLVVRLVVRSDERAPRPAALVAAGAITVVTGAVGLVLHRAVGAALWTGEEPALKGDGPTAWVVDPAYWVTLVIEGAGQLLYVVLSTAGLALGGAVLLCRMVWRPVRPGERLIGATLGLMLASNLAVSTVVMAGFLHESDYQEGRLLTAPRWDHMVYGRYNDAAAVILATLGVVWLAQVARRRDLVRFGVAGAAIALVCGLVVDSRMSDVELRGRFPTPNASGLTIVPFAGSGPAIWLWTATAMLLVGGAAWAASRGRRTLLVALGAWLAVAGLIGVHQATESHRYGFFVDLASDLGPADREGTPMLVPADTNVERFVRMSVYQAQLGLIDGGWHTRLETRSSEAVAADPGAAGALLLMEDVAPPGADWHRVERYGRVIVWRRD